MTNKTGTLALTILMVTVGLVTIAPPAAAGFACTPVVGVDSTHSPARQWTTHSHPRFTFPLTNRDSCPWVATEVYRSWGTAFRSSTDDLHADLWSGEFYIKARVLQETLAWENGGWVTREVWGRWVTSPTVTIDLLPPHVGIAGISGPFVEGPEADYLTNETEITLSASDSHSGVDRVEYRIDDGAWQAYTAPTRVTGDDGEHTFTYRAIDNMGHETVKNRHFILDNTAPDETMIRPNANSATFGDYAVELDPVLDEIDAARDQVVQAAEDARDHLPEEVDDAIGQFLDEQPEALDNVTVDGQDVNHEPVYLVSGTVELELDVQDAWVGTANVSFLVDGGVKETQSNGDDVYRFTWDTTNVPAGRHDVTLQATDRLGNQGEWTFATMVISSTAPEAPDPDDMELPA